MNLILFEADELRRPIPLSDPRATHVVTILKAGPGDEIAVGVLGGKRGKARIVEIADGHLTLQAALTTDDPGPHPVEIILGHPRPLVLRRLFKDLTALGVSRISVAGTDLGEKSYQTSSFWTEQQWNASLVEGATQAGSTYLPEVRRYARLDDALADAGVPPVVDRIAFDNASPAGPLRNAPRKAEHTVLAVGPERGWSDRERRLLAGAGFYISSMGRRALRTETAASVAVALVLFLRDLV